MCYNKHMNMGAHQPSVTPTTLFNESDARGLPTENREHPNLSLQQSVVFPSFHWKLNTSLTSSMFLIHAGHTPASSPGMFWNVLGLLWKVLPFSFITPSSLCSNYIFSMSPTLALFIIQSSTHSPFGHS